MNLLTLSAPVDIQAAAETGKAPRVSITAYTGGAMRIGGWGNVAIDLHGLDASGQVALLSDHDPGLQSILGHGVATVVGSHLNVEGTIPPVTDAAKQVIELARSGFKFQASVGVQPSKTERLEAGATATVNGKTIKADSMGLTIVRAGKLKEVSILAMGADSSTSVTVAATFKKGTKRMSENQKQTPEPEFDPYTMHAWENPSLSAPEKILARWNAAKFVDQNVKAQTEKFLSAALSGTMSMLEFDNQVLRAEGRDLRLQVLRASYPTAPMIYGSSRDGSANPAAVLEAAFLTHLGHESLAEKTLGAEAMQRGRDLRINSMVDWCKASLQMAGRELPAGRDQIIKAAFSTVDFSSGILSNSANKMLMAAYSAYPSVARVVAGRLSAKDFKAHSAYRLTGALGLEEVGPAGEIKHGTLRDAAYPYAVKTFAKMLSLTRQDIINDDLGAFDTFPGMFGRSAANTVESLFWTLVLANTGSFFAGANGNYIDGTTSALSLEGLGKGVEKFLKMTDTNGDPIGVVPRYLVVPPELKATADSLYRSTTIIQSGGTNATQAPGSSPFFGLYEPLAAPHLSNANYTGYSTSGWYLFGNPNDVPAFGIAYLDGKEAPTVETQPADFDQLGVQFRAYIDVGVCQVDTHGAVKSKGTT